MLFLHVAVKVLYDWASAFSALSLSNPFLYYGSRYIISSMDPLAAISTPISPKVMVTCHPGRIRKLGSLNGHKKGHPSNHLGGRSREEEMSILLSSALKYRTGLRRQPTVPRLFMSAVLSG